MDWALLASATNGDRCNERREGCQTRATMPASYREAARVHDV